MKIAVEDESFARVQPFEVFDQAVEV